MRGWGGECEGRRPIGAPLTSAEGISRPARTRGKALVHYDQWRVFAACEARHEVFRIGGPFVLEAG